MATGTTDTRTNPPGASMSQAASQRWIDPAALMRIASLELRARVVVEGFRVGMHKSPYHGFSVEFTEYRQYAAGDDLRYVDWRLFARSDRYYVKRFEDETNLRCHLLVDQSRSMEFGSLAYSKLDYANTLAASLAHFLGTQRDAVGLLTFDESIREYLPARYRPGRLHRLMLALDRPAAGRATDLVKPLDRIAELVGKRGLMALVSDLLAPVDAIDERLARLRARGHDVVVFQVLDPREASLDFDRPLLLRDLETEREMFVDPQAARGEYVRRFEEHNAALRAICDRLGIEFHRLSTDQPLEFALFDFLRGRMRRGREARRNVSRPTRSGR